MSEFCETCGSLFDDQWDCGECDFDDLDGFDDGDFDAVGKPFHYNHSDGIECIEYIKQVLGKEGFVAYCRGNVMKYNHRAFYKGNPTEDMSKAEAYLKWANDTLKEIHK